VYVCLSVSSLITLEWERRSPKIFRLAPRHPKDGFRHKEFVGHGLGLTTGMVNKVVGYG